MSLFHQTSLQHSETLALWALHLIFIWSMKAGGMLSSQTPCEKPVESWLNICSVGRQGFDTLWYHSTDDANLWYSASRLPTSVCFPFFIIIFLIQKGPTASCIQHGEAFQHLPLQNSIMVLPFCLSVSRSHSSKTLKPPLSFFITLSQYHKSEPMFIHTMLGAIVPGEGGEDRYQWHQSQACSSLGLPLGRSV